MAEIDCGGGCVACGAVCVYMCVERGGVMEQWYVCGARSFGGWGESRGAARIARGEGASPCACR